MMRALLALSRAIDALNERVGRLADWCVLLAVVISAGNALVRYGFSYSSNAWLEIQWYLFAGMFMLGAPYTLKRNEHVRVDVIYGALPPRAKLCRPSGGDPLPDAPGAHHRLDVLAAVHGFLAER
jgi:TRAP-type mannitol/chloroaromatic compound transport system permease small subunit